jgi:hypothetical protein
MYTVWRASRRAPIELGGLTVTIARVLAAIMVAVAMYLEMRLAAG